jgi:hypothetical protein
LRHVGAQPPSRSLADTPTMLWLQPLVVGAIVPIARAKSLTSSKTRVSGFFYV